MKSPAQAILSKQHITKETDMWNWVITKVSKKLFTQIFSSLLTVAVVAVNKSLGSPLDDATIVTLVAGIVANAVAYLFSQGSVDKAKVKAASDEVMNVTNAKAEILKADVANPNTPTTASDVVGQL
jgi:hypothetical protein